MALPFTLPTRLTLARIAAVPFIVALLLAPDEAWAVGTAFVLYALAGITDWLDGYLARRDGTRSHLGALLDPIADKMLVAAVLVTLVHIERIEGWGLVAALIILLREIAVSGMREFMAGLAVEIPVTALAKWKTAAQMVALGLLIIASDAPGPLPPVWMGTLALWIAAVLSAVTGWDYARGVLPQLDERRDRTTA